MKWHRVKAEHKLAFREDMQSDPMLTDLQKRMISTIATHWDNGRMEAECSESFIAKGAGTTIKMVKRYKTSLSESGRVSIKRAATWTTSTMWDVNWWFRGSAWVRATNGGKPIIDCRVVPKNTHDVVPVDTHGVVPVDAGGWSPTMQGGGPQVGTQFPSKEGDIGAPVGACPLEGTQGPPKKERKENPHKIPAGFAKWKIIHAEFVGDDCGNLVMHMRSGKSRQFVFRCDVDDAEYDSLDEAMSVEGDASYLKGEAILMSTNKSGPKQFMRAGPSPWGNPVNVISGYSDEDGASVRVRLESGQERDLDLTPEDADALADVCGGEDEVIGAAVFYRVMPDDSYEWRIVDSRESRADVHHDVVVPA